MKTLRPALLIAVGALLIVILIGRLSGGRGDRARFEFEGLPLHVWVLGLDPLAPEQERSNAVRAVLHFDSNAVPVLVGLVTSRTDVLKFQIGDAVKRYAPVRLAFAEKWAEPAYFQSLGVEGLRVLGPRAVAAIAPLSSFLTNTASPGTAAYGLAAIGPQSVPDLIRALDCTNDQPRITAIGALQKLGPAARDALRPLLALYRRNQGQWWGSRAITNAMYRIDAVEAERLLQSQVPPTGW